ncbi:MTH1187 family thiamine-binding protein [bacterium]|nr:MTH1187 family thiamine-binding protein [bacterium]
MNTNIICELVVVTYDIGPSLSPFVAQVIDVINQDKSVQHLLTPMGSVIEGKYDDVMNLVRTIFYKFAGDYERLGITIKIDFRASKQNRIKGKIESVKQKLSSL